MKFDYVLSTMIVGFNGYGGTLKGRIDKSFIRLTSQSLASLVNSAPAHAGAVRDLNIVLSNEITLSLLIVRVQIRLVCKFYSTEI